MICLWANKKEARIEAALYQTNENNQDGSRPRPPVYQPNQQENKEFIKDGKLAGNESSFGSGRSFSLSTSSVTQKSSVSGNEGSWDSSAVDIA